MGYGTLEERRMNGQSLKSFSSSVGHTMILFFMHTVSTEVLKHFFNSQISLHGSHLNTSLITLLKCSLSTLKQELNETYLRAVDHEGIISFMTIKLSFEGWLSLDLQNQMHPNTAQGRPHSQSFQESSGLHMQCLSAKFCRHGVFLLGTTHFQPTNSFSNRDALTGHILILQTLL